MKEKTENKTQNAINAQLDAKDIPSTSRPQEVQIPNSLNFLCIPTLAAIFGHCRVQESCQVGLERNIVFSNVNICTV